MREKNHLYFFFNLRRQMSSLFVGVILINTVQTTEMLPNRANNDIIY